MDNHFHLDQARVEALTRTLMQSINANYEAGPMRRDRVFEALNALAICVAYVWKGTDCDPRAIDFFRQAMADQLIDIGENKRRRENSNETQHG